MANQSTAEARQLKWVLDLVGSPLYAAAFCAGIAVGLKEGVLGMLVAPTLGLRRKRTPTHKASAKVADVEEEDTAHVTGMQAEARAPLPPVSIHVAEPAAAPGSTPAPAPVPVTIQPDQPASPDQEAPRTPQPAGSSLTPSVASASPTPAPFATTDMPQELPLKTIATETPTSPVNSVNGGDAAAMIATTPVKGAQAPASPAHPPGITQQFLSQEPGTKEIASVVAQLSGSKMGTSEQGRQAQLQNMPQVDMPQLYAGKADRVSLGGSTVSAGSAANAMAGPLNTALTTHKPGAGGRHKAGGKKAALR